MKSSVFLIVSLLLVAAITAPSIIILANSMENKGVVLDFNEEEKKEDKKEVNEKEFFLDSNLKILAQQGRENTSISSFYVEIDYSSSLSIILPPPKYYI